MSRRLQIPMARLQPTTQRVIWAGSSWAQPPGQSLRTGVDIGGRHTPMGPTILTQRHTEVIITARAMVIIMQRLITTLPQEPMAGNKLLPALMGRPRADSGIIPTPGPTPA